MILEFRDCLIKFEILSSSIPELVINEIYAFNELSLEKELKQVKSNCLEKLNKFDVEKVIPNL